MAGGQELPVKSNSNSEENGGSSSSLTSTLWACGAVSQVAGAVVLHKRGDGGPSMPLRAFSIATLILGAGFCVVGSALHAGGIREVNDLVSLGQRIRLAFGKPPAPTLDLLNSIHNKKIKFIYRLLLSAPIPAMHEYNHLISV